MKITHFAVLCNTLFSADSSSVLEMWFAEPVTDELGRKDSHSFIQLGTAATILNVC